MRVVIAADPVFGSFALPRKSMLLNLLGNPAKTTLTLVRATCGGFPGHPDGIRTGWKGQWLQEVLSCSDLPQPVANGTKHSFLRVIMLSHQRTLSKLLRTFPGRGIVSPREMHTMNSDSCWMGTGENSIPQCLHQGAINALHFPDFKNSRRTFLAIQCPLLPGNFTLQYFPC